MVEVNIERAEKVASILSGIEHVSGILVEEIEQKSPGHIYGRKKAEHMQHLASEAESIGSLVGLDQRGVDLLRIVLRSHDLGRHVEALKPEAPKLSSKRHGNISVGLLNRTGDFLSEAVQRTMIVEPVLKDLDPEDRFVVNYATFWHAERKVPTPKSEDSQVVHLANKICYLLRDLDKEEIFLAGDYFQNPQTAYYELKLHYLTADEKANLTPEQEGDVYSLVQQSLKGNKLAEISDPSAVYKKAEAIMNNGINPSVWPSFDNKETISATEITYSWATYALMQLAMVFDIKLPQILRRISQEQDRYLGSRIDFLKLKASPTDYQRIEKGLKEFFQL